MEKQQQQPLPPTRPRSSSTTAGSSSAAQARNNIVASAETRGNSHRSSARSGSSSGGGHHRTSSNRPRVCRVCGQHHSHYEPHLYNYESEVDEDLMCQICLQPFVQPVDTPCAHTFCNACLHSYLRVNPMCPLDRKPVNEMTISPSNLVLKRLLDKLAVTCPNADSCKDVLQRGNLDDHLRYRCSGTLVACQYAGAGCDFRGPSKSMQKHQAECKFKKEGITRLPVLEGEVSHVEIPRTNQNLGITIVGGADTPLRCVVVQEVYPDGLIAQDGRLRPGDQIIEINGVDMTCASHAQICAALRKMSSVLRLGVYRERIEKYSGKRATNNHSGGASSAAPAASNFTNANEGRDSKASSSSASSRMERSRPGLGSGRAIPGPQQQKAGSSSGGSNGAATQTPVSSISKTPTSTASTNSPPSSKSEELFTVTLERGAGHQLGIRLSGNCSEPGIYIVDIQEGSTTAIDGRLNRFDRLLFINGQDVRHCRLEQASALIQNNDKVSIVVARRTGPGAGFITNLDDEVEEVLEEDDVDGTVRSKCRKGSTSNGNSNNNNDARVGMGICHTRSKSAPAIHEDGGLELPVGMDQEEDESDDDEDEEEDDEYSKVKKVREEEHFRNAKERVNRPSLRHHKSNGHHHHPPRPLPQPALVTSSSAEDLTSSEHVYDVPNHHGGGDDFMAIYETLDRVQQRRRNGLGKESDLKTKSHSMEALETPTPSLKSFEFPNTSSSEDRQTQDVLSSPEAQSSSQQAQPQAAPRRRHRSKPTSSRHGQQCPVPQVSHQPHVDEQQQRASSEQPPPPLPSSGALPPYTSSPQQLPDSLATGASMAALLKRALRIEGPQLTQRNVVIKKNVRESLGMRIGGGIGSNEGDTPIYIANIHPHGCIGKSKQMKKGDLLLSVDDVSLCGLTHTQAVATLKATINRASVTLGVMDGPETSFGASNFIPSWMFWQKLPRTLQYPKTVILHRREHASWGFSIVGGAPSEGPVNNVTSSGVAPTSNRPVEPIHVLFVVPDSPAAKDAKIKCGDRLLAVDGHSLENIPHSVAVAMLKQTSTRVVLEVVSWMGTEL